MPIWALIALPISIGLLIVEINKPGRILKAIDNPTTAAILVVGVLAVAIIGGVNWMNNRIEKREHTAEWSATITQVHIDGTTEEGKLKLILTLRSDIRHMPGKENQSCFK